MTIKQILSAICNDRGWSSITLLQKKKCHIYSNGVLVGKTKNNISKIIFQLISADPKWCPVNTKKLSKLLNNNNSINMWIDDDFNISTLRVYSYDLTKEQVKLLIKEFNTTN